MSENLCYKIKISNILVSTFESPVKFVICFLFVETQQLERLGPARLTGALKWLGFHEKTMPKNGVQLAKRLFATKGIPLERITENFFDDWVDEHNFIEPQFLDLRKIYTKGVRKFSVLFGYWPILYTCMNMN